MSERIMLRELGLPTYEQVHAWLIGRGWVVESRGPKDRVIYRKPGLRGRRVGEFGPRVWTCTTYDWADYDRVILDLVDGVAKAERLYRAFRLGMVQEMLDRNGRSDEVIEREAARLVDEARRDQALTAAKVKLADAVAEQFRGAVDEIRRHLHDDEVAHSMEDDLRRDALKAIAEGAENAEEIARIALSTDELDFERWCA